MKNLELAKRKMASSEWNAAIELLNRAMLDEEDLKEVYYWMSVCWLKQAKPDKALEVIEKALSKFPDDAMLISERGVIYFHLGKKSLALLDMDKAVMLEPENPYRYSSRAFIKDSLGDLDGAITDYEKAIKLDPNDAIAHNNLGLLLEKKGYVQKSKNYFAKADSLTFSEKDFVNFFSTFKVDKKPENNLIYKKTKPRWKEYFYIISEFFQNAVVRKEFFRFWVLKIKKGGF